MPQSITKASATSCPEEVKIGFDHNSCSAGVATCIPDIQQAVVNTTAAITDITGVSIPADSPKPALKSLSTDQTLIAKKATQKVPDRVNQLRIDAWSPHEAAVDVQSIKVLNANVPAACGPPRLGRLIEAIDVLEGDQQVFVYAILDGSISQNAEYAGCSYLKALRAVCPRIEAAFQKHTRIEKMPGHRITHVYIRGARAQGLADIISWIGAHILINGRRSRRGQNQLLRNIADGDMPMYGYLMQAFAARHLGMEKVYSMRLRTIENMQYKPNLGRHWQRDAEDIRACLLCLRPANQTVRPMIIKSIVDSRVDGKLHHTKWSAIKAMLDANLNAFGQEVYGAITLERLRRGLPEPRPYIPRPRRRSAAATSRTSQNIQYIPQLTSKQAWQPKRENGSSKRRKKAAATKLVVQTSK